MIKKNTKDRIWVISFVLFAIILAIWIIFYFIISSHIAGNTKSQMTLAANQIIERLGGEFSQAESVAYGLARNENVKELVTQEDISLFYPLAEKITNSIHTSMINSGFAENIIIYNGDNKYYRLLGKISNKSCSHLASIISTAQLPSHLGVELEGHKYIGYVDSIPIDSDKAGAAVILAEEEKILEIMRAYDQAGALLIAIKANEEIITANTDKIDVFLADSSKRLVISSRLGITPFEILVSADAGYMNASVVFFSIVAFITAAVFGFVLIQYSGMLNRRFLLQDNEIKSAQLRAKTAEIERQKALVFSLKKQINAHFTINTLNAIRILVEQEELEKSTNVALGLTSLIRYAYDKDELIDIWEEYNILEDYVLIMNTRYDDKLEVDFDFDGHLMGYSMPRMLLQPIIENAVMHGFKEMDSNCFISIKAKLCNDFIEFIISDNGAGMMQEELTALCDKLDAPFPEVQGYENIALLNIKNRLHHYYEGAGQLRVNHSELGGIAVTITIPPVAGSGGQNE